MYKNNHFGQAEVAYKRGLLPRAANLYRKAIDSEPSAEAYAGLAACLLSMKQYAQAIEVCNKALSSKLETASMHNISGYAYMIQKQFSKSEEEYRKALALNPLSTPTYIWLAELYRVGGRSKDAETALHQALQIDSRSAGAYDSLRSLYHQQGMHVKAIQAARQAHSLAPSYRTLYCLANEYIQRYFVYHVIAGFISVILGIFADPPLAWAGLYMTGFLLLGASAIFIEGMRKFALMRVFGLVCFVFIRIAVKSI